LRLCPCPLNGLNPVVVDWATPVVLMMPSFGGVVELPVKSGGGADDDGAKTSLLRGKLSGAAAALDGE